MELLSLHNTSEANWLALPTKQASAFALEHDPVKIAQQAKAETMDLREAAEQLVATTFITPLLKELRDDPLGTDFLDGGFTEDAFRQQLDVILADQITKKSNLAVVDQVYQHMSQISGGKVDARG